MSIQMEIFGSFKDPDTGIESRVLRYILSTSKGLVVKVISLGASINSIQMPDKENQLEHIVLGFDSVEDYLRSPHMGTTVGRVANRVAEGKFSLAGKDYQLTINNGNNHLHGGTRGWDKYVWKSCIEGDKVVFSHISPEGDQGYPGDVMAQVTYSLEEDGTLKVDFHAMSSAPTPINMTNHAYFNLAGHGAGKRGLLEHEFEVFADYYLPVSSNLIPTGERFPVEGSPFDLRKPKLASEALAMTPDKGFDHCFCVVGQRGILRRAAIFKHPPSGRQLQVLTTEPGVQVYTGNFLPDPEEGKMEGFDRVAYTRQGAFCCEPQNYPDAINQVNFPSGVLLPGQRYEHSFVYKFTTD